MHTHHKTLLAEIEKHQRKRSHSQASDSYLSSGHLYYDVSVPERRAMAKAWPSPPSRASAGTRTSS